MRQPGKRVGFNRVANTTSMSMLLIAITWIAGLIRAHADGGAVQFEKPAGRFVITVFTTPSPLRAGPVDLSLMIRSRDNRQAVLDGQAFVQLHKAGAMSIRSEATHEAAQNKLLYAAPVNIPEAGLWELEVAIERGDETIKVAGELTVASANPVLLVYWRSLILPPLFISLFVVNQWLKRRNAIGGSR